MLDKTELQFKGITDVVGGHDISLICLTDISEHRALTIVCDEMMKKQILLRIEHKKECNTMLPEIMANILKNQFDADFEIVLNDVIDGNFRAMIVNKNTFQPLSMRATDAILLHITGNIPLYATNQLMQRQSVKFDPQAPGISLPFNSLSNEMLQIAMTKAVQEEQYEVASKLRDELKRRGF